MNQKQEAVKRLYREIALSGKLYSSLSEEENIEKIKKLSESLGYDPEDIESEANMGLGCGNPLENAHVKAGEIIVDLGCGKGLDTFKAAKIVGDTGQSVGIDRLFEMVDKAKEIARKRKFHNTKFIQSEIDQIDLPNDYCDCVISNCVINLVDDKKKVYQEIYRILKPNGRVSISDIIQYHALPDDIKDDPKLHAT